MTLADHTIVQLIDSKHCGGIETHILQLSRWLRAHGLNTEVVFLARYGAAHPLERPLLESGISVKYLDGPGALFRLIFNQRVILATHGYKAGILGRMVARCCGTPVISTFHSGDPGAGKLALYSRLDEMTAGLAQRIICVSGRIQSRLNVQSSVIPNFVKAHRIPRKPGDQIAFVGRLSQEKGPDLFTNIAAAFKDPSQFHIYGDGPLRTTLQVHNPRMTFHGHVKMEQHWHKVGLLCITSRFEGMPLVALEAMSRGIPVIAYAVGDLHQLIDHHQNGWLIPQGERDTFIKHVQLWQSLSPVERQLVSDSARKTVAEHYDSQVVCPRIVDQYAAAIQAAR